MIYEFLCNGCGKKFDEILPLKDSDKRPKCPTCNSNKSVQKIVGGKNPIKFNGNDFIKKYIK